MVGSVVDEKSSVTKLELFLFSIGLGLYTVCIAKTASNKIGVLICSTKFVSSEGTLDVYHDLE